MKDSRESVYDDVLFMKNLGVSEDNIALLKNITLSEVNQILASFQVDYNEQKKVNVIQEVGNQNKWKDKLPDEEILKQMVESLEAEDRHDGARTVPSRPINAVDRSDRVGEDRKMNDRLAAMEASADAPKALKDIVESATIAQRKRDREEWKNVQNSISELLDDDLDL